MSGLAATSVDDALAATAAVGGDNATPPAERTPADLGRGALVGRYVVLSRLGAGGMGVVFAAYDPELDRKVALKLLHPRLAADSGGEARARLLREALALARLNHPNIVAIHDVGEHQGTVWLAMEYVDGETLSAWLKQRRRNWREVLAVMTAAARGLAGAHDAGLVHRDIKPDNIMVGRDGRVRVMDLGLARAHGEDRETAGVSVDAPTIAARELEALSARVTRAGAVLGTPAYMSPEQFRGEPVDARADMFSFCVTLWEALMGERPFAGDTLVELAVHVLAGKVRSVPRDPYARRVPGWLRRVCLRGLAVEPERRLSSMEALLDALSHGRARARVRTWLVGAAAIAALGASSVLYQRHDRAARIAACEEAGASIFDTWSDEARAGVRAGLVGTGLSYAPVTADKVMPFLDAQAQTWRENRTRVCLMADVEGTLDAEHMDRAVWCLDERRMELAALLTELSHADRTVVQRAVTAAADLPPMSSCTDGQVLAALPSPPPADNRGKANEARTTLSQARALLSAGNYPEGLKRTRGALAGAEALDWPPVIAAARQLEGSLLLRTGAYAEAEAASLAAYMEAAKVRAWHLAAPAAFDLVENVGHKQARHLEGTVWAGHAELAVLFAGDPLGLREATRLNNLAGVQFAAGAYDEAKALVGRALKIREKALGPDHPHVAAALNGLASLQHATGAYPEAKALHERALAIREKAFGPEHPDVASSLSNLASVYFSMGAYDEARALYERALAIREKALGPDHPEVAGVLNNLAAVHYAKRAYAEAKALHERALAIREKALGPEHPVVAASLYNVANIHKDMGAYAEAKVLDERALAIREKTLGPEHPDVALSLAALGYIALEQGQPSAARSLLERAITIFDAHEGVQEGELTARLDLAKALVRTGGDRVRAVAEARKAADALRDAGTGKAGELAEVEAFLAEHDNREKLPTP